MKVKALIFCLLLILAGCKEKTEKENNSDSYSSSEDTTSQSSDETSNSLENNNTTENNSEENNSTSEENTNMESENTDSSTSSESTTSTALVGRFIKTDHQEDTSCNCYCIDVSASNGSELCLVENEMYINTRFSKSANAINIFYARTASRNKNEELPWDEFDKNEPIAVITPQANGNFKLDWKGFSINGDLAVDYALFGKKTLEGTYKKQ